MTHLKLKKHLVLTYKSFAIIIFSGTISTMPLEKNKLEAMIREAFPDATIILEDTAGDNNHYSARICSKVFNDKTRIEQHKMVYRALKGKLGNELHALALETTGK